MKNINIFDDILNTAAILNFQQIFDNKTVLEVYYIQKLYHFIQRLRYQKLMNFCAKKLQFFCKS
jgi:hypothetical protein